MKLLIDYREPIEKIAAFKSLWRDKVEIVSTEIADYYLEDLSVGIERKTPRDLLTSICGRLWNQLQNLRTSFKHPYIVVEGSLSDVFAARGNFNSNSIIGAVASIMGHHRVPVLFTDGYFNEVVVRLFEKHIAYYEELSVVTYHRRLNRPRLTALEEKIHVLTAFPNINLKRAQALYDHFGSLKAVFNSSENELIKVRNIGPKTAKRFLEVLK